MMVRIMDSLIIEHLLKNFILASELRLHLNFLKVIGLLLKFLEILHVLLHITFILLVQLHGVLVLLSGLEHLHEF